MAKNKTKSDIAENEIPLGYLTLKEAAEITDYTPDYIGQLVRAGKIEGKQIYSNVSWVASEESLKSYLSSKGKDVSELSEHDYVDLPEMARPLLYLVIGVSVFFLIILVHVFSVTVDRVISFTVEEKAVSTLTESL